MKTAFGMSRLVRHLLQIVATAGLALPSVHAQPTTLRVAIADVAPYAMKDGDGQAFGLYPELVKLIGVRADFDMRIQVVPCAQLQEMVDSGQVDLVVSVDAAALRRVSRPVAEIAYVDSVVVARSGEFNSDGAQPFRLGHLSGGCMGDAQPVAQSVQDSEVASLHEGVRQLAGKRLDGLSATRESFFHYANINSLDKRQFGAVVPGGRQMTWLYAANQLPTTVTVALWQAINTLKEEKAQRGSN